MFKQLYRRALDWRPACRRDLNGENQPECGGKPPLPHDPGRRLCCLIGVDLARCPACGIGWLPQESMVQMCPLPTKSTRESLDSSSGSIVSRSTIFDSFPECWAFLTCYAFPDGSKRQGGKMSLSCELGMWQLVLTDPSTSLYACLTAPELDSLILMAEARLSESTMPWRPSNYSSKRKG